MDRSPPIPTAVVWTGSVARGGPRTYRCWMKCRFDSGGRLIVGFAAAFGLALGSVAASPAANLDVALQVGPAAGAEQPASGAEGVPAEPPAASVSLPTILRSESDLPEPVRETRRKLIEAAKSGDIKQLGALMQAQAKPPSVAFGDPGDPIEYLKALAADADGREILAILLEVLQSGFVHSGAGTADDMYVWPYFAQYPIDALTPQQLVELFTLLTAADYEDMKSYGAYTFFRVGIAPDGRWLFFLAGD